MSSALRECSALGLCTVSTNPPECILSRLQSSQLTHKPAWANWFFLIGFACPIIQYYIARKYPRSILRYVFFPALFGVSGMIPPATIFNLLCYLTIGIIFNVIIKRRFPGWWERYTYSLAGALDVGNALCLILYALALGLSGSSFPEWWGTTGFAETLEAQAMAVSKTLKDGEVLAPWIKSWN